MFLNMKKKISTLLNTVNEMLIVLCELKEPVIAISDCLAAIEAIHSQMLQEDNPPYKTLELLRELHELLKVTFDDLALINENHVGLLISKLEFTKSIFHEEVKAKLNVVFFPYKASMWDSLATIYEAAAKDDDCVAQVVPIPYYQLSRKEAIPTYEGDRFPENVPITHFNQYSLESEQPDIIFVHNIYDQYNSITQVHEHFYTSNLKKYTGMLVFVPYHISSFIPPQKGIDNLTYSLKSMENVDKIILVGEFLKKTAIRDGVPKNKILALGSPKIDGIVNTLKEESAIPDEWKEKIHGKTVYLLNTGCLYFANNIFANLEFFINFLSIPRFIEDSILIWRPHPLTHISIKKYIPEFELYYLNLMKSIKNKDSLYSGVILDERDDYFPALKVADVLISQDGSLLRSYLLTERKVIFVDEAPPKRSLLPSDIFYYAFDRSQPWYEIAKNFSKGLDPLAKNRKGMAAKVYANTDGTSGEKVYQAVKDCVLNKE